MTDKITENEINDELLIHEVRGFPELWDKKCKGYRNNRKKDSAWIRISERLQQTIEDLKARWKAIRDKFVREKKIIDRTKVSGSSASNRDVWDLYDSLHFLKDSISHRRTINNMSYQKGEEEGNVNVHIPEKTQDEDGDYVIHGNSLSDDDESNTSLSKAGTSSSLSSNINANTSSKTSSTSNKRECESDHVNLNKYKKSKPKADAYEQTLLKIWKESNEKINNGCDIVSEDPDRLFLMSLEKDLKSLNDKNKRKAKHALMEVIDKLIEEEERVGDRK